MPKKALAGCTISLFGRNPNWESKQQAKVGQWLANISGKLSGNLSPATTHLIVSKKRWTENPKPALLQQALDEKANGRELRIVSFDWLEDCLNSQSKKREVPYEWEKRDADAAKLAAKGKKAEKAKSVPGIMSEVFHESTEQYVDPIEKQRLDAKLDRDQAREKEEKDEILRKRKEQMSLFGQGARKAKKMLLTGKSSQAALSVICWQFQC